MAKYDIVNEMANGVDIQIDILGIARKESDVKLFFIEAKKTRLTLRDLGQLWAYCKLVDPDEAFLLSSADLGSLNKLLNTFRREDLLDFGDKKKIKKMRVGRWDMRTNSVDYMTLVLDVIPATPQEDFYKSETTKRVAVYARVSTDDPNQTSSYELQKNHYEDMVNRRANWVLVDIYAEM